MFQDMTDASLQDTKARSTDIAQVAVRFFAGAADAAGTRERTFDIEAGATVAALFDIIAADFPEMAKMKPTLRFAVNLEFADLQRALRDGDEIAIIPPVSGG